MKRFKVVSGFCIAPGRDVYPGDEVTFETAAQAAIEVRLQRVVEIVEGPAPEVEESKGPEGEAATSARRTR